MDRMGLIQLTDPHPILQVPHICRAFFTPGDRMIRNEQAKAVMWLTRPKLTSTWAAGFAFNKVGGWGGHAAARRLECLASVHHAVLD